jgi:hypothetical protein
VGRRRSPNGSLSEPHALEAAHSGMVTPATKSPLEQLSSTRVTDTPRPRKKRKVVFNGVLITSPAPQPSQRPSSPHEAHEGPPTSIRNSTSEAVALPLSEPTMLRSASQAENLEANPSDQADPAETSRKKRKRNSAPFRKGSSPEHGAPNHSVVKSPDSRKKRKEQTTVSVMPTGT